MSKRPQFSYDGSKIVIVPTVSFCGPPAKKPKLSPADPRLLSRPKLVNNQTEQSVPSYLNNVGKMQKHPTSSEPKLVNKEPKVPQSVPTNNTITKIQKTTTSQVNQGNSLRTSRNSSENSVKQPVKVSQDVKKNENLSKSDQRPTVQDYSWASNYLSSIGDIYKVPIKLNLSASRIKYKIPKVSSARKEDISRTKEEQESSYVCNDNLKVLANPDAPKMLESIPPTVESVNLYIPKTSSNNTPTIESTTNSKHSTSPRVKLDIENPEKQHSDQPKPSPLQKQSSDPPSSNNLSKNIDKIENKYKQKVLSPKNTKSQYKPDSKKQKEHINKTDIKKCKREALSNLLIIDKDDKAKDSFKRIKKDQSKSQTSIKKSELINKSDIEINVQDDKAKDSSKLIKKGQSTSQTSRKKSKQKEILLETTTSKKALSESFSLEDKRSRKNKEKRTEKVKHRSSLSEEICKTKTDNKSSLEPLKFKKIDKDKCGIKMESESIKNTVKEKDDKKNISSKRSHYNDKLKTNSKNKESSSTKSIIKSEIVKTKNDKPSRTLKLIKKGDKIVEVLCEAKRRKTLPSVVKTSDSTKIEKTSNQITSEVISDLRKKLSLRNLNELFSKQRYRSKFLKNSTEIKDNLKITVPNIKENEESEEEEKIEISTNVKPSSLTPIKYKKIQVVINVTYKEPSTLPVTKDITGEKDGNSTNNIDLSFLDDINIDEIVNSLEESQLPNRSDKSSGSLNIDRRIDIDNDETTRSDASTLSLHSITTDKDGFDFDTVKNVVNKHVERPRSPTGNWIQLDSIKTEPMETQLDSIKTEPMETQLDSIKTEPIESDCYIVEENETSKIGTSIKNNNIANNSYNSRSHFHSNSHERRNVVSPFKEIKSEPSHEDNAPKIQDPVLNIEAIKKEVPDNTEINTENRESDSLLRLVGLNNNHSNKVIPGHTNHEIGIPTINNDKHSKDKTEPHVINTTWNSQITMKTDRNKHVTPFIDINLNAKASSNSIESLPSTILLENKEDNEIEGVKISSDKTYNIGELPQPQNVVATSKNSQSIKIAIKNNANNSSAKARVTPDLNDKITTQTAIDNIKIESEEGHPVLQEIITEIDKYVITNNEKSTQQTTVNKEKFDDNEVTKLVSHKKETNSSGNLTEKNTNSEKHENTVIEIDVSHTSKAKTTDLKTQASLPLKPKEIPTDLEDITFQSLNNINAAKISIDTSVDTSTDANKSNNTSGSPEKSQSHSPVKHPEPSKVDPLGYVKTITSELSNSVSNSTVQVNNKSPEPICKDPKTDKNNSMGTTVLKGVHIFWARKLEERLLETLQDDYRVVSLIHKGTFSTIYHCKDSINRNYAAKIKRDELEPCNLGLTKEKMLMEIQRDIPRNNLNFVYFKYGLTVERRWCFLMEFCPMTLQQVLTENKTPFNIDQVQHLSRQLVAAVLMLRNNNIVHSDIKPSHILLNSMNNRLKLCGFDSAYTIDCTDVLPSIGTINYRAPEIILGFSAGYSIDVWSTALVMYEMQTGIKLFPGIYNNDILYKQMCTLGNIPYDMITNSRFRDRHFCIAGGLRFKRQISRTQTVLMPMQFVQSNRLSTSIRRAYYVNWAPTFRNPQDLAKLEGFYFLLVQMLALHPNQRMPIEFVCANPFIHDFQRDIEV